MLRFARSRFSCPEKASRGLENLHGEFSLHFLRFLAYLTATVTRVQIINQSKIPVMDWINEIKVVSQPFVDGRLLRVSTSTDSRFMAPCSSFTARLFTQPSVRDFSPQYFIVILKARRASYRSRRFTWCATRDSTLPLAVLRVSYRFRVS